MSYEYEFKEYIRDEILSNINHMNILDDALDELDHVYSQAALNKEKIKQIEEIYKVRYSEHIELKRKADEYEAKAKAYNDTLETLDKLINDDERYKEARSNDFVAGMLLAYEKISILMEDYIKESGEQLDEYEKSKHRTHVNDCKAEAFDAIFKLYIGYEDGWISFPRGNRSFIEGVTNVCKKYESGESDV